jgi:uncharacterized SAM-binding protein YcdF (DUF218 family)
VSLPAGIRRTIRELHLLARPAGWLLAAFVTCNALGELLRPGFAVDHFWIRSAKVLGPLWRPATLLLAAALLAPDLFLDRRPRLTRFAAGISALFALFALADAGRFWWLLAAGRVHSPAVLPFSLLVAAVLADAARRLLGIARRETPAEPVPVPPAPTDRRERLRRLAAAGLRTALAGGILTLAFIFTYGPTDYTAPADCAVVLGSKAYRDASPSLALYDRTMTAVDLYRRGLVGKLVMSGGVDRYADGTVVSEPQVCRRLALDCGVPDADIILDEAGTDSWATVRNARRLAESRGWHRVLLVSHYYHLPRLRLAADRAGLAGASTVPCRQTRRLRKEPYGVLRECAGLAFYYLFRLPQGDEEQAGPAPITSRLPQRTPPAG